MEHIDIDLSLAILAVLRANKQGLAGPNLSAEIHKLPAFRSRRLPRNLYDATLSSLVQEGKIALVPVRGGKRYVFKSEVIEPPICYLGAVGLSRHSLEYVVYAILEELERVPAHVLHVSTVRRVVLGAVATLSGTRPVPKNLTDVTDEVLNCIVDASGGVFYFADDNLYLTKDSAEPSGEEVDEGSDESEGEETFTIDASVAKSFGLMVEDGAAVLSVPGLPPLRITSKKIVITLAVLVAVLIVL